MDEKLKKSNIFKLLRQHICTIEPIRPEMNLVQSLIG